MTLPRQEEQCFGRRAKTVVDRSSPLPIRPCDVGPGGRHSHRKDKPTSGVSPSTQPNGGKASGAQEEGRGLSSLGGTETMANRRFEMTEDARADLRSFAQRLEDSDLDDIAARGGRAFQGREKKVRKNPLGKLGDFFFGLSRLPQTRRRVLSLEEQVEISRRELSRGKQDFSALLESAALKSEHVALKGRLEELARLVSRENMTLENRLDEVGLRVDEQKRVLQTERLTRQRAFTDLERRFTIKGSRPAAEAEPHMEAAVEPTSASVRSVLESFYFLLEDRYRGSREEIKQRLLVYRNDFRAARDRTRVSGPVIDIGCGRGEMLEMLGEEGFQGLGVDSNAVQLETARKHGAAVIHGDAAEYLRSLDAGSVLAVTGIHIVEHIPFPALVELMLEVIRVLRKGGLAIFETPNPRNLIVGSTTFHLDPTHIKPLPSEVLQILLETVGFDQVETRPLHPSDALESMVRIHKVDRHLATLLFGPQDYAIVGISE
jgi:SAM-dependent methyltransferase